FPTNTSVPLFAFCVIINFLSNEQFSMQSIFVQVWSALVFGCETGILSPMLSQDTVLDALKSVKYPGYSRDIVSFGLVKEISAANGAVSVTMQLTAPNPETAQQIKIESERVLKVLPGVNHVLVEVRQPAAGQTAPSNQFANQKGVPG